MKISKKISLVQNFEMKTDSIIQFLLTCCIEHGLTHSIIIFFFTFWISIWYNIHSYMQYFLFYFYRLMHSEIMNEINNLTHFVYYSTGFTISVIIPSGYTIPITDDIQLQQYRSLVVFIKIQDESPKTWREYFILFATFSQSPH